MLVLGHGNSALPSVATDGNRLENIWRIASQCFCARLTVYVEIHTWYPWVCAGFLGILCFPPTSQKHASRWTGYAQLCLTVKVQWTCIPPKICPCLIPSVVGMDFRATPTVSRMKFILKKDWRRLAMQNFGNGYCSRLYSRIDFSVWKISTIPTSYTIIITSNRESSLSPAYKILRNRHLLVMWWCNLVRLLSESIKALFQFSGISYTKPSEPEPF